MRISSGGDGPDDEYTPALRIRDGPGSPEKQACAWAQYAHKTPWITYHIFEDFGRVKIYKFPWFFIA
jgi:hypothetical protein